MASHKIVHWELMGPDAAVLNSFYHDMFGWKGEEVPGFGGYTMIPADDTGVAGAIGAGNEDMPSYQTMYIEVASIDEYHESRSLGRQDCGSTDRGPWDGCFRDVPRPSREPRWVGRGGDTVGLGI